MGSSLMCLAQHESHLVHYGTASSTMLQMPYLCWDHEGCCHWFNGIEACNGACNQTYSFWSDVFTACCAFCQLHVVIEEGRDHRVSPLVHYPAAYKNSQMFTCY